MTEKLTFKSWLIRFSIFCMLTFLGTGPTKYLYAQNEPNYWLPGGIRVLDIGEKSRGGKIEDYPDNQEARNWLIGFWETLQKICPPTAATNSASEAAVLQIEFRSQLPGTAYAKSYAEYTLEAGKIRPEGSSDAALLAKASGCGNAQHFIYNGLIVILHKSRDPEPQALPRFLKLASPQFRLALGYTETQFNTIVAAAAQKALESAPPVPVAGDGHFTDFSIVAPTYFTNARRKTPQQVADINRIVAAGQLIIVCHYGLLVLNNNLTVANVPYWYRGSPRDLNAMLADRSHPLSMFGTAIVDICPKTYTDAQELRRQTVPK